MRIFVANVGANQDLNAKYRLKSPIFDDGTFEFVPIRDRLQGLLTYQDLESWTGRARGLAQFVPKDIRNSGVHADPEFLTFTYGDGNSPRAGNLKILTPGDQLWFVARLWEHNGQDWVGRSQFYLIGFFEVEGVIEIPSKAAFDALPKNLHDRMASNAHVRRLEAGNKKPFRVVLGDPRKSRRFKRALKVSQKVAGLIYGGKYNPKTDGYTHNGETLPNKNGKPRRFKTFGSVTRSIQPFLNSMLSADRKYMAQLRKQAEACGTARLES